MKKIVLTIIFMATLFTIAQAQYSTYYSVDVNHNLNVNANINKNINISGSVYENKTITTIDYGALQLANAQREENRLENAKFADDQQRRIALEIASDPVKAFDFGDQNTTTMKGKEAKSYGFRSFTLSYRVPHNSVFVFAGEGRLENVSREGVTTEILFSGPVYNKDNLEIDIEKNAKMEGVEIGKLNPLGVNGEDIYIHKKETNRATVYGLKGFKGVLIWEDDYQYAITDNFQSYDPTKKNGVTFFVKIRTYGSKNEVTFEELEGRRFYLRQLIEKVISTATCSDFKFL